MRIRDVPVRELGGLVEIQAVIDDQADLAEPFGEFQLCRCGKDRVVAQDDQDLDLPRVHRGRKLGERRMLADRVRLDRRTVSHCRADVSERLVHRVRERVHGGRLIVAGHDNGPAAMRLQVLADGGDPLLGERARRAGLSAARAPTAAARLLRESLDIRRAQRQAVLGLDAGQRRRALNRVEPIHPGGFFGNSAAIDEVARVAHHRGARAKEIGVERHDDVGLVEVIDRRCPPSRMPAEGRVARRRQQPDRIDANGLAGSP